VAFPVTGSRRRTFFIAILLSITLITLDIRGNPAIDKVRSVAREAFSPFQGAARKVFRPFEHTWNGIRDYDRLKKEYERERDRANQNAAAAIEAEAQLRELNAIRAELRLSTCSGLPTRFADIIGRPATNYDSELEISIGSEEALQFGMPVIEAGALVGRVGKVSKSRAFVSLITDPNVSVQVQITGTGPSGKTPGELVAQGPPPPATSSTTAKPGTAATTTSSTTVASTSDTVDPNLTGDPEILKALNEAAKDATSVPITTAPPSTTTVDPGPDVVKEFGVMHGNGPGELLSVSLISAKDTIKVGDPVSTVSNRISLFPGCIPIGRVASVTPRKGSTEVDVKVKPVADLAHISVVTVIIYKPDESVGPITPTVSTTKAPASAAVSG
jgi:cell shape-determining protein MreC